MPFPLYLRNERTSERKRYFYTGGTPISCNSAKPCQAHVAVVNLTQKSEGKLRGLTPVTRHTAIKIELTNKRYISHHQRVV
jgi:hypothetical protein